MQHVCDSSYKGQELMVFKDGSTYVVDVREDMTDGAIVAGFTGLESVDAALGRGREFINAAA